tara:strand:+ start:300 stop:509 length:210 start_codon:yes stop_codon:yes gene_type:complete
MSEIESQTNDLLQLQGELERIFTVLEGGIDLSKEQIDLLRHGCGFSPVNRQRDFLQGVFNDLNPYGRSQ